jgi:enoyl-CoA hydratase
MTSADTPRLQHGSAGASVLEVERRGDCLLLTMKHPPVNSLAWPLRRALWQALSVADADESMRAVIITGAGRGFSAGGEFSEFGTPLNFAEPALSNDLFPRIEAMRKPVIAALHGFAIGGGLELALACHHRVALRDTQLALPEVRHGLIPPSGSQRLPRAIGLDRALALMLPALTLRADELQPPADATGPLFAALCDADAVGAALGLLAALAAEDLAPATLGRALLRHRALPGTDHDAVLQGWRAWLASEPRASAAMRACLDAVEQAARAPSFDAGLALAKRRFDELALSSHDPGARPHGHPPKPA